MKAATRLAIATICISSAAFAGDAPKEKNMKPVDVLQKEHGIIKKMALKTGEIAAGIEEPGDVNPETLAKLHDFFVNFADKCHHAKEEDELFPQLREKEANLSEAFHRIETVKLGKGFHEKYHGMAMEILGKAKQ